MGNALSHYSLTIWQFIGSFFMAKQSISKSNRDPVKDAYKLFEFPSRLSIPSSAHVPWALSRYTIFTQEDVSLKQKVLHWVTNLDAQGIKQKENFALGCFIGMAVGDALGAPLEFSPLQYNNNITFDMGDAHNQKNFNRFMLKPGQWTDDTSMGLCLADSLLVHPEFKPTDLRVRFLNWWEFGYRNAFGYDTLERHSVGLGGNIGDSMMEFRCNQTEYTKAGDKSVSGNGSLMRLAAVPIFYHANLEKALDIAYKQSKTTHQGDEAAECCRLMTFIIVSFINADRTRSQKEIKETVLSVNFIQENFHTDLYAVQCLATSMKEERHQSNADLDLTDRDWNWKNADFRYSPTRARAQPGYIGSYSMDALAMSLHCLWTTEGFSEALLKVVNLRGDADTVGSITGQLAGSLYGVAEIPKSWVRSVQQWDNGGEIALTGHKLFHFHDV